MIFDAIIIGSGLSGLACSSHLTENGFSCLVLDKGYLAGGRTASKPIETDAGTAIFDYGAQYFTVDHLDFQKKVNSWIKKGIVKKWATQFVSTSSEEHRKDRVRYMGTPTMRSICEFEAEQLNVMQQTRVIKLHFEDDIWNVDTQKGEQFRAKHLILTPPAPQTLNLCYQSGIIPSTPFVNFVTKQAYHSCITLLVASAHDSNIPKPGGIWFDEGSVFSWAADNKVKGISDITALTIHLNNQFSKEHYLKSDEEIFEIVEKPLKALHPFPVVYKSIHRWKYAQPVNIVEDSFIKDDYYTNLWFTGDIFINGRIEDAWLSGLRTAKAVLKLN